VGDVDSREWFSLSCFAFIGKAGYQIASMTAERLPAVHVSHLPALGLAAPAMRSDPEPE